ncbi:lysozyme C, milk isozyme [Oreochromis niloticus]|uniref:lysozyme C, milk isozyme n=1 Tax=Oreochromis niloticus TaxID=8128 RepID=UPI000DF35029|nr:lysozyme C, milk isozyme [Oreochromis niloticus]
MVTLVLRLPSGPVSLFGVEFCFSSSSLPSSYHLPTQLGKGRAARPAGLGAAQPIGAITEEEATAAPPARHPTAGLQDVKAAGCVLGCGWAGGRIVPKCELRDQLIWATSNLPQKAKDSGLDSEKFVTKIVCFVENVSEFNTSLVSNGLRDDGIWQKNDSSGDSDDTLYGIFQLWDQLVCGNGTNPSPNICAINCMDLIDDDIQDDVRCLMKLFVDLVENGFGAAHWKELKKEIKLILQDKCKDKQAAEYFAECY